MWKADEGHTFLCLSAGLDLGRRTGVVMSAQPVSARDLGVEPEAETYRLHQLVDLVRAGRMRLPHFQRELKWGKEDVVALFDSIFPRISDRKFAPMGAPGVGRLGGPR